MKSAGMRWIEVSNEVIVHELEKLGFDGNDTVYCCCNGVAVNIGECMELL